MDANKVEGGLKYFMVMPFVPLLKKWIAKRRKGGGGGGGAKHAAPPQQGVGQGYGGQVQASPAQVTVLQRPQAQAAQVPGLPAATTCPSLLAFRFDEARVLAPFASVGR